MAAEKRLYAHPHMRVCVRILTDARSAPYTLQMYVRTYMSSLFGRSGAINVTVWHYPHRVVPSRRDGCRRACTARTRGLLSRTGERPSAPIPAHKRGGRVGLRSSREAPAAALKIPKDIH